MDFNKHSLGPQSLSQKCLDYARVSNARKICSGVQNPDLPDWMDKENYSMKVEVWEYLLQTTATTFLQQLPYYRHL